ncbi:hypothetical protein RRG08_050047 [Elysia crispata]|uniref:VWFC domain-containing protein n=1 Tax=Elysia crispata TaxID=231223 RepID=A0AAE1BB50_9GAST|nr:hypothetical protein RRG08_050047 [Elysia crispata]
MRHKNHLSEFRPPQIFDKVHAEVFIPATVQEKAEFIYLQPVAGGRLILSPRQDDLGSSGRATKIASRARCETDSDGMGKLTTAPQPGLNWSFYSRVDRVVAYLIQREIFLFKLKMVSLLCILAFGLSAVSGLSPVPNSTEVVPTPKDCTYNGVIYKPGEKFSPDPCTFCECDDSGQHVCAKAGCVPPPCVDPVSRPDKCCAFCLNGPNCLAPDNEVIKQGDFHTTDKGAVCHCPVHPDHFWGPQKAICMLPVPPAPPGK